MNRPTCSTCPFYDPKAETMISNPDIPMASSYYSLHLISVPGLCCRESGYQPHRKPSEWCSHHPDFDQWRSDRSIDAHLDMMKIKCDKVYILNESSVDSLVYSLSSFLVSVDGCDSAQQVFQVVQNSKVGLKNALENLKTGVSS
jgi:hypothetical protein